MNKKHQICLSLIFLPLMLISIVACNNIKDPNITIEAQVANLSVKEFNSVGTHGLDNPIRDDFRKFTLNFNMENSNEVKSRSIEIPNDWGKFINFDRERYLYGNGKEQDNEDENFARYTNEFVFYSKGLSEDDIKNAFNSANITVSWVTKEGKSMTKEYVIGDLIKFN